MDRAHSSRNDATGDGAVVCA